MDIMGLMKQAKDMKEKFERAQVELDRMTVSGTAAGGMVTAEVNGMGLIRRITLDAKAVNPADVAMLEDLIVVAVADAQAKAANEAKLLTGDMTAGLKLPF